MNSLVRTVRKRQKGHQKAAILKYGATPNAVTLAAIENTLNRVDIHGPFDSVEALMQDLNA